MECGTCITCIYIHITELNIYINYLQHLVSYLSVSFVLVIVCVYELPGHGVLSVHVHCTHWLLVDAQAR